MVKQAIIHVENTQNLVEFAEYLHKSGWKILSANKTEELLEKNKIPVTHEQALEEKNFYIQETAHLIRRILLTRIDSEQILHNPDVQENNIYIICVNLYPFLDNPQKSQKIQASSIKPENFFISTIIRNAFSNFENLLILTDPADYKEAIIEIKTDNISKEFRLYLAAKALNLISAFDGGIASSILQNDPFNIRFLNYISFPFRKEIDFHQGMNAQQKSCLYRTPVDFGALNGFTKISGRETSYMVAADATFAWEQINSLYQVLRNQFTVKSENQDGYPFTTQFTPLTGTVLTIAVKMSNILGAGLSSNVIDSFKKTFTYDTQNINDVTLGCSAVIDINAAQEIAKCNIAVIIAPSFTPEAKDILSEKNIKLIAAGKSNEISVDGKLMSGGILLQEKDRVMFKHWKIRTRNRPSQVIADEMALGTRMVMGARSYSAVLIKGNAIVGIAQSALSPLDALERVYNDALKRKEYFAAEGQEALADVLVCDTPIPLCQEITKIIDSGVSAILQPGGTNSDSDFANYCDEKNIVMVFSDMTHINF
ncbi:MAG: hypothetical protein K5681_07010 [Treponema sp.]|nr:hypothetical protein [Treponema sp.]